MIVLTGGRKLYSAACSFLAVSKQQQLNANKGQKSEKVLSDHIWFLV
jgi:hypothetical protein